jgi:hypothetical protein
MPSQKEVGDRPESRPSAVPTIGFCTTASLKWSMTAAMAKTPPSRSYSFLGFRSRLQRQCQDEQRQRCDEELFTKTLLAMRLEDAWERQRA